MIDAVPLCAALHSGRSRIARAAVFGGNQISGPLMGLLHVWRFDDKLARLKSIADLPYFGDLLRPEAEPLAKLPTCVEAPMDRLFAGAVSIDHVDNVEWAVFP